MIKLSLNNNYIKVNQNVSHYTNNVTRKYMDRRSKYNRIFSISITGISIIQESQVK